MRSNNRSMRLQSPICWSSMRRVRGEFKTYVTCGGDIDILLCRSLASPMSRWTACRVIAMGMALWRITATLTRGNVRARWAWKACAVTSASTRFTVSPAMDVQVGAISIAFRRCDSPRLAVRMSFLRANAKVPLRSPSFRKRNVEITKLRQIAVSSTRHRFQSREPSRTTMHAGWP